MKMKLKTNNVFWNFNQADNENNQPAELILYGDIASTKSWWDDEITPQQFNEDLLALGDVEEIVVRINSGGGDVFAANAIYTRLKDHNASITVKIDGWAGSAATIISMAADKGKLFIPSNGVFMIHDPTMGLCGYFGRADLIKLADRHNVIKQSIINGYALRTGMEQDEISNLMAAETWLTGKEAVEKGFCDSVLFEEVDAIVENSEHIVVNSVSINLNNYKNIPTKLLSHYPSQQDNGFSNKIINNAKKKEEDIMSIKTVDDLKTTYPNLVKDIQNNATIAERNRIKDIEEMALNGYEEIVKNAKFDNPIAAADVAMKIVAEQKKQGENYLDNRNNDVKDSKIGDIGNENYEDIKDKEDNSNLYDAAINKLFPEMK